MRSKLEASTGLGQLSSGLKCTYDLPSPSQMAVEARSQACWFSGGALLGHNRVLKLFPGRLFTHPVEAVMSLAKHAPVRGAWAPGRRLCPGFSFPDGFSRDMSSPRLPLRSPEPAGEGRCPEMGLGMPDFKDALPSSVNSGQCLRKLSGSLRLWFLGR